MNTDPNASQTATHRFSTATELTPENMRERLQITDADFERVKAYGKIIVPALERYNELFYGWMERQPEWQRFFTDPKRLEHVQRHQMRHWKQLFECSCIDQDYIERRYKIGEIHARIGLSLTAYLAGIDVSLRIFTHELFDGSLGSDVYAEHVASIAKLVHADAIMVVEAYSLAINETIRRQAEAMMEMSTPVTELCEGVLMLPVVGIIDSARAQDIMTSVLRRVALTRAKVFLMDVGGVAVLDTAVADHLIKISKATQLMGCRTIMCGLSQTTAQTIVELGIDVSAIDTTGTLRDGLSVAYKAVGLRLIDGE